MRAKVHVRFKTPQPGLRSEPERLRTGPEYPGPLKRAEL